METLHIPPPQKMDMNGDIGSSWECFVDSYNNLQIATKTGQRRKATTSIHIANHRGERVPSDTEKPTINSSRMGWSENHRSIPAPSRRCYGCMITNPLNQLVQQTWDLLWMVTIGKCIFRSSQKTTFTCCLEEQLKPCIDQILGKHLPNYIRRPQLIEE